MHFGMQDMTTWQWISQKKHLTVYAKVFCLVNIKNWEMLKNSTENFQTKAE